ncbi:MAG: hypothetical protein RBR01_00015 [Desulfobacterales bacterium]|jgi:hypothetical protein|nr:hypothetical protein [Desulfobacterales bacterium]MDD4464840.1 hypothetical protein [Desulfobacterales bacterium]MDY0376800.1 hypothetical protein [Desulfobacterales bacterium]
MPIEVRPILMGFLIFMVLFILDDAAGQEFYEIIFPAVISNG